MIHELLLSLRALENTLPLPKFRDIKRRRREKNGKTFNNMLGTC